MTTIVQHKGLSAREALPVRLKDLIKASGRTQKDIAAALFVDQATVSCWTHGHRYPDVHALSALADILSVSADYLLGRSDRR